MKKLIYPILAIISFFIFINISVTLAAGGVPPPPGGGGPPCLPPPCVPIDGGISFLVAAGIAIGAKKMYNSHQNVKNKDI